jgi:hypothetical protein
MKAEPTGEPVKPAPAAVAKPKQQRSEDIKPKPPQNIAPRAPRPVQSSGPLGWLR